MCTAIKQNNNYDIYYITVLSTKHTDVIIYYMDCNIVSNHYGIGQDNMFTLNGSGIRK